MSMSSSTPSSSVTTNTSNNIMDLTNIDNLWDNPRHILDAVNNVPKLLETEWLLTDGLGGFAMGTALGVNTRRYHGLLVTALSPPVQCVIGLSTLFDQITIKPNTPDECIYNISSFQFEPGSALTGGYTHLVKFEKGMDYVRWLYRMGDFSFTRELKLNWRIGGAEIQYQIAGPEAVPVRLIIKPLVRLIDYHHLMRYGKTNYHIDRELERNLIITSDVARLVISPDKGFCFVDPDWWYNFSYKLEKERGQDYIEDLFSPGVIVVNFNNELNKLYNAKLSIICTKSDAITDNNSEISTNAESFATETRKSHILNIKNNIQNHTPELAKQIDLLVAADDFVVPRTVGQKTLKTILAGYPWFSDWGRDTMISLPGLLLVTKRFSEALETLQTFAAYRKNGLIPNRFDDNELAAHYNTVDASLWFIHAACEYRRLSGDHSGFMQHLAEPCLDIILHYKNGTDFGIKMDIDGLIIAGDSNTQLTWMDAKRDGVVFTPRYGKAVEINALWYHCLQSVCDCYNEIASNAEIESISRIIKLVRKNFAPTFMCKETGCLADCVIPVDNDSSGGGGGNSKWQQDKSIRPNQLFAVSLSHSPLSVEVQKAVVDTCEKHLLTHVGLRTLSPEDPAYKPRFTGDMFNRDSAYHQGTVWPWLLGPFVEAILRVNNFNPASRKKAAMLLEHLCNELYAPNSISLGQLYEVYDGQHTQDQPRKPGGCIAQAWSVAELVRCLALLEK